MKKNCSFILLILLFFCVAARLHAQYQIKGEVMDAQTGEPVPAAMILLLPQQSEQPLAYTLTDQEGRFALSYTGELRVLRVLIRHLSYREYTQLLVLAEENTAPVVIRAALQPQVLELGEVVVQEAPPIIVKRDTILYNIEHWRQASDQTLEDVLRKMPGFVVLPNGDIQYNGKIIQKVLVDGKEVSNVGAAVVTRSIDPSKVESVEVRTNEKNHKLKNSLLDRNELLVLDVKLKKDIQQSFFGRVGVEASFQEEEISGGGLANMMHIGKHTAAQLIAEQEPLGITEISIYDVRSIGAEAMQELLGSLTMDFEELKNRDAYAAELYGVNDYLRNPNTMVGGSFKWQVTPHSELTLASFNQYNELTTSMNSSWSLAGGGDNQWLNEVFQLEFKNKSKLLWSLDNENTKSRVSLNIDYHYLSPHELNYERVAGLSYDFRRRQSSFALLPSLFYERLIGRSWAVQLKAGYMEQTHDADDRLLHNDSTYIAYLQDDKGSLIRNFRQMRAYKHNLWRTSLFVQYAHERGGDFRLGADMERHGLDAEKQAFGDAGANWQPLAAHRLSGAVSGLQSWRLSPFLSHQWRWGALNLNHTWRWAHVWYPSLVESTYNNTNNLEVEVKLSSNIFNWQLTTGYERRLVSFPLLALSPGDELKGFRSILRTRVVDLKPRLGEAFSFTLYKDWYNQWDCFIAINRGKIYNAPIYNTQNLPFIEQIYAQQLSSYLLAEIQLSKNFIDPAAKLEFVQSFLQNGQENINGADSTTYRSDALRWMTELNFSYGGMRSRWKLIFKNKLSNYAFRNELIEGVPVQRMFSSSLGADYELILERLLVSTSSRYVYLYDAQSATFWELNAALEYITPKWRIELSAGNLLNNREFVMQDVSPLLINTNYRRVLPRYVKIGVRRTF